MITLILLVNRLFEIADQVITKGIPLLMVLEVLWYLIPSFVALTVPMAVIVSFLTVFSEMNTNNEIVASYSSGIHPFRFFRVPFLFAVLLTAGLIFFNTTILPRTNIHARRLLVEIKTKKPVTQLIENTFAEIDKYHIYVEKILFREGMLKNVLIYEHDMAGRPSKTITALEGKLTMYPEDALMHLELINGTVYELDYNQPKQLKRIDFYSQDITLQYDKKYSLENLASLKTEREMTNKELMAEIEALKKNISPSLMQQKEFKEKIGDLTLPPNEQSLLKKQLRVIEKTIVAETARMNRLFVEYHKKYSLAFMSIVFACIAYALGLMTRTRQKNHAYVISIVIFVFYWVTLIGGEDLGDRGIFAPWLSMWLGNIIMMPLACLLMYLLWRGHFHLSTELFTKLQTTVEKYAKNFIKR